MANTVTIRQLTDSPLSTTAHVYIAGDGSGEETNKVIMDCSALAGGGAYRGIVKITGTLNGFSAKIKFDQTTPSIAAVLPESEAFYFCFDGASPYQSYIFNPAGSGTTGDITLDTTGLGATDVGFIVITAYKTPSVVVG